jgi:hypothetical protein
MDVSDKLKKNNKISPQNGSLLFYRKPRATLYNGLLLGGLGFLGVFVVLFVKKLTQTYNKK